jgi:3-oxoacyl-[acyl-carrier protein] reductase
VNVAAGEEVAEQIKALGASCMVLKVDATNNDQVTQMVDTVVKTHGHVDILSNNAGGASGPTFSIGRVLNISEQDWDDTITINVKSVFLCSRAVAKHMLKQQHGAIVNMASVTGHLPWAGLPAYSAAKAAVISLTRSLAIELAPYIRVNAIAPGLIETARTSKNRRPEQLDQLLSNVWLHRMGQPEDIADIAVYLASDVANYVTGTIIDCTGGQVWMSENGSPNFRDAAKATSK